METVKSPGVGWKGMNRQGTRVFRAGDDTVRHFLGGLMSLHTFQNPHLSKPTTQKANSGVNYGLELTIMYRYWLLNCNTYAALKSLR